HAALSRGGRRRRDRRDHRLFPRRGRHAHPSPEAAPGRTFPRGDKPMSDQLQTLWQSQKGARAPLSLAQLADAAPRFERQVRPRNVIEYVAGALVVLIFSGYAVFLPDPMLKLGSVMVIAGAVVVMHQLWRRARAGVRDPAQSLAAFHRAELERQRAALS